MSLVMRGPFGVRMLATQSRTFYGRKRFGPKERTQIDNITYPIVVEMPRVEESDLRWYLDRRAEYPSVTSILRLTMPSAGSFLLSRWRRKKESELGAEEALKLRRDIRQRGTAVHQLITDYILGELREEKIPENLLGYWHSFRHVLNDLSEPMGVETTVVHQKLHYAGTCDCIAKYRGKLCVIDWKTSDKPRPTLDHCHDFPLQAVAYAGAVNVDKSYPFKVDHAMIVVGYKSGLPADAHFMPRAMCEQFWKKWLDRLEAYRNLKFLEEFDSTTI